MKKQKTDDLLVAASTEAIRLGLSYGRFAAMCWSRYPGCINPIARYFESRKQTSEEGSV